MATCILIANWRWVVTFSLFLHHLFLLGTLYNYSILFLSFQREFNTGAMVTGWVGTLAYSLTCLLSPLSSLISLRFGCRTGSILGVVSFCVGLFATSLATELWHTFLSLGILLGFGANLILVADNELLSKWLEGNSYYRATALASIGSSVGILVMSLSLTFLISSYGWRICLRLLSAGILIVCVPAALALRDPDEADVERAGSGVGDTKAEAEMTTREILPDQSTPHLDPSETPPESAAMMDTRVRAPELKPAMASGTAVETRLVVTETAPPGKSESGGGVGERLNLSMFRLPYTWLYCTAIILASNAYTFTIVNIASFMDKLEFTKGDTTLTISLFAVGECLGKLVVAEISHAVSFPLMYINGVCCVVAAVITGLMALTNSLPLVHFCFFVFGMMRSSLFGLVYGGSRQLFGDYGMPAVSLLALMPFGIGGLIAAPMTGGLYDLTGDYTLSLLVILACFLASSACFILTPRRWELKCLRHPCPVPSDAEDQGIEELRSKLAHNKA